MQVARCEEHNAKAGLAGLCSVRQGNFLSMPFKDGEFDAAYSIEATCHAPNLESVYSEIYRGERPIRAIERPDRPVAAGGLSDATDRPAKCREHIVLLIVCPVTRTNNGEWR